MNHTPTPWQIYTDTSRHIGEGPVVSIGRSLGNTHCQQYVAEICGWGQDYDTDEEQQANAAHIVRCVNAHDSLVAALEQIAAQPMSNEWSREIARAALAKAKAK